MSRATTDTLREKILEIEAEVTRLFSPGVSEQNAQLAIGNFVAELEKRGYRIVHPDHVTNDMVHQGHNEYLGRYEDWGKFSTALGLAIAAVPRFTEKENG